MITTIHPVEMCNQNCSYCINYKGNRIMSDDTLVNTIDFLTNLYPGDIGGNIEFHSVEPTLRGLPFFIRAEELLQDFEIDTDIMLATNTTSNMWMQDIDGWCQFLSDNKWVMNISLDGPEYIHDRNRGKGNWKKVIESLIHIKDYDIGYGIISTIKYAKDLNDVYDFFISINEKVQLNPTIPFNDMTNELCNLFDRWLIDGKRIRVEPFSKIFNYFTGQRYIKECPNICTHNIVSIDTVGDVRPCGFFWDNTDLKDSHVYGNVNTNTFDEIWFGAERQKMLEYIDMIPADCMICPWIDFCGTGCSYVKHAGADKCGYIKELLEHTCWLGDN